MPAELQYKRRTGHTVLVVHPLMLVAVLVVLVWGLTSWATRGDSVEHDHSVPAPTIYLSGG